MMVWDMCCTCCVIVSTFIDKEYKYVSWSVITFTFGIKSIQYYQFCVNTCKWCQFE